MNNTQKINLAINFEKHEALNKTVPCTTRNRFLRHGLNTNWTSNSFTSIYQRTAICDKKLMWNYNLWSPNPVGLGHSLVFVLVSSLLINTTLLPLYKKIKKRKRKKRPLIKKIQFCDPETFLLSSLIFHFLDRKKQMHAMKFNIFSRFMEIYVMGYKDH